MPLYLQRLYDEGSSLKGSPLMKSASSSANVHAVSFLKKPFPGENGFLSLFAGLLLDANKLIPRLMPREAFSPISPAFVQICFIL